MFQILADAISLLPDPLQTIFGMFLLAVQYLYKVCVIAWYRSIERSRRELNTKSRQIYRVCKLAKSFRTLYIALNVMSICADDLQELYNSLLKLTLKCRACRYIYGTNKFFNTLIFRSAYSDIYSNSYTANYTYYFIVLH